MRNELSTFKPAPGPTVRLMENKGWRYTVSAEYKRDFILLQDKFGRLFRSISKAVKSQVPVDDLKEYLCENFDEFNIPLQETSTTDDVMKAVRNQSSLTDLAYFDRINDHFNLQVTQEIDTYRDTLDSFCRHTLDNHSYVRSFREDYDRYILSSDKIVFQLQWKAREKTLKDIRDVLQMSFGHLVDRVQIVVIKDGSVVVVCWAPQYLMEELVSHASRHVHRLAEMGVVKLTVGGTEVNIEKPSHWLREKRSQSSEPQRTESTKLPSSRSRERQRSVEMSSTFLDVSMPTTLRSMPTTLRSMPTTSTDTNLSELIESELSFVMPTRLLTASVSSYTPSAATSKSSVSAGSSRYEKQPKKITYLTRLSYPRGMVISQGHLIVAEFIGSITIINTDSGEKINRFGKYGSGQVVFNRPEGVSALTQDGH